LVPSNAAIAGNYEDGVKAFRAQDYERALRSLKPLAEAGDGRAQAALGLMYERGLGLAANSDQAMQWYEKAANQGLIPVAMDLGGRYFRGSGVKRDPARAVQLWQKAADAGVREAQFNLGLAYVRGLGTKKDDAVAAKWFERAAQAGYVPAEFAWAACLSAGVGIKRDEPAAVQWYRKAADHGFGMAAFNLGVVFENGIGLPPNPQEAMRWYRAAASKGAYQSSPAPAASGYLGVQASRPAVTALASMPPAPKRGDKDWLFSRNPSHATLQLTSLTSEQAATRFIAEHGLDAEGFYLSWREKGAQRYIVFSGEYDSLDAAQKATRGEPHLARLKPWIRPFSALQHRLQP
jgi:TPR repeat protein